MSLIMPVKQHTCSILSSVTSQYAKDLVNADAGIGGSKINA